MRIYWTLKQIPELAPLPSAQRHAVWQKVYFKTFRHWETWIGLLFCPALTWVGTRLGTIAGAAHISMLIGAALGGLVYSQAGIYVARRYHAAELLGKS